MRKVLKCNYHMKSCLPTILLFSMAIILASCVEIKKQSLYGRRSLKKALLWAQQDSIRVADSLANALIVADLVDETLQDSLAIPEEEILTEEDTKDKCYIIMGTFTNPENAKRLAEQYRNEGYQSTIIRRTNSSGNILDMVSIKTFNNYNEALRYIQEFHSTVNSSAYLYSNR